MLKTTQSDRVLIIVLVTVLLACLGGQLVIRPVREKNEKAVSRIESVEEKLEALRQDQNSFRIAAARKAELEQQTDELLNPLTAATTAAELEQQVGSLIRNAGLAVSALELTGPKRAAVESLLEGETAQASPVQTYTLTYSVIGTYDALLALRAEIAQHDSLAVSALEFSLPTDENGSVVVSGDCTATLTVTAYQRCSGEAAG